MSWSNVTATDTSRQFVGIGPIDQDGDVDFVLTLEEERPITISDEAQPFIILQEVMEQP